MKKKSKRTGTSLKKDREREKKESLLLLKLMTVLNVFFPASTMTYIYKNCSTEQRSAIMYDV